MSFNTFGKIFRFTTWGESHGPAIGCVVDGCPPNIKLSEKDIMLDMNRRRPGKSKFTSQRKESDKVNILSGVFQGKILVKEGAQKTDGYQISQSLLLDDDSQFLAKPELEIYADDVACSHGSTSGAIDEQALFYLCSRGISKSEATDMLTLAFLAEAVEEIENENVASIIVEKISAWLSRREN